MIAKVSFDYAATQDDELNLKVGDVVTGIKKVDAGWWEGELNGKRGMFPENFVEEIEDNAVPPAAVQPTPPPPSAVSAPKSTKKFVKVTFDYDASQEDELELKVGQIIELLEDDDDGWWKGKINGKQGMFPSNFVEVIKDEPISPLPTPLQPGKIYNQQNLLNL